MSSPVRPTSPTPDQHWSRPCGENNYSNDYEDGLLGYYSEFNVLDNIIVEATLALNHAEDFRNDYINHTFHTSFESHHRMWNQYHLEWLPKREHMHHKVYGETVDHGRLHSLDVGKIYKDIYTFLQQIAVGVEQVRDDQKHPPLQDEFRKCSANLNKLLCEIQSLLLTKNVPIPQNVSPDIMPEAVRELGNHSRIYRDWLIFREYMNVLEYTIQVLTYVKGSTSSS